MSRITLEQIDEFRAVAKEAIPGPYQHGFLAEGDDPMNEAQFIDWQRDAHRLGVRDRIFLVSAPRLSIHDLPEREDWEKETVTLAVTGNGPYSEANARFIAYCTPANVLALLDEIERLRSADPIPQ